jgi:uncharacterized protein YcbK (DUF882 family)
MNNRREFFKKGLLIGSSLCVAPSGLLSFSLPVDKTLHLHNVHTGESINATFHDGSHFIDSEVSRLNRFFRDFRENQTALMDKNLYNILYGIQLVNSSKGPIEVLSGYRSVKTNQRLKRAGRGVARNSFHTRAQAIDFNLPSKRLKDVLRVTKVLKLGGVGFYPKSGFIHIDTGPVRYWRG